MIPACCDCSEWLSIYDVDCPHCFKLALFDCAKSLLKILCEILVRWGASIIFQLLMLTSEM